MENIKRFGTAPVFFTAISTILGAILFLRFGIAAGTLGFWGVIFIIIIGHMVTIPTALALSEIATNQRVKGGGEYFVISRSFGLNIGATIGIALFFSQAISIAFYVIAFTEAFEPFFNWFKETYNQELPRQVISIPAMTILAVLILRKGANIGVKALYIIVGILFVSLVSFFLGDAISENPLDTSRFGFRNSRDFFTLFAICFPAFTGMTAGVGLSGDLKNPSKSIPRGTITATLVGMVMYVFIAWKLTVSADPSQLTSNQLIMSDIAIFGGMIIPLGLAASTISSALGSIMVAPRTLQALAADKSFPFRWVNIKLARGKGKTREPRNAAIIAVVIAYVFIALGNVDVVAEIISMFFMVTYGSLCLISFLNHFGSAPSYRPSFKSRWFLSLLGFVMCLWLMFKIDTIYAFLAIAIMIIIYLWISHIHRDRKGMQEIFSGAIFQFNRKLHLTLQQSRKSAVKDTWRPSVLCISKNSFEREKPLQLLEWISYQHGYGTFVHLIEGYFSKARYQESEHLLGNLIEQNKIRRKHVYVDTIISPSYTSAIAQIIQMPGIFGLDNNMVIFEYDKLMPSELDQIVENISLVKAGNFDIGVYGCSPLHINYKGGIHVWIKATDFDNSNLMILLSYIILNHPDWKYGKMRIFDICKEEEIENTRNYLTDLIQQGRLHIPLNNIELIPHKEDVKIKSIINEYSNEAGFTVIGFREEQLKHDGIELFTGYDNIGDIFFINTDNQKVI